MNKCPRYETMTDKHKTENCKNQIPHKAHKNHYFQKFFVQHYIICSSALKSPVYDNWLGQVRLVQKRI